MSARTRALLIGVVIVAVAVGGVGAGRSWAPHSQSTTTSTTIGPSAPASAIWPSPSGALRLTSPVEAALSFAANFLDVTNPLAGASSGKVADLVSVPIYTDQGNLVTTVTLLASSGHSWWVMSASTPSIVVSEPTVGANVGSPLVIAGRSTASEGVVNVDVRHVGSTSSIARLNVIGGSMGVMGPFRASISFTTPATSFGAVMFRTRSAKDGSVIGATVVPVNFN